MKLKLFYRAQVHERTGELVYDSGMQPSHSYVIQYLELMYGILRANGDLNATDVANAESLLYDESINANQLKTDSVATELYGIVVGLNTTGPTAEDNLNYKMDTIVVHGNGGGQLNYQQVVYVTARDVAGNIELDVSRPFINNSGGQIDIEEIGLIIRQITGPKYFLLMRDVIGTTAVGNTQVLTVTYVLQTVA